MKTLLIIFLLFFVSNSLLDNKGFIVNEDKGQIFSPYWIRHENEKGIKIPNITYGGSIYYGGFSDHFPIYMVLKKQ